MEGVEWAAHQRLSTIATGGAEIFTLDCRGVLMCYGDTGLGGWVGDKPVISLNLLGNTLRLEVFIAIVVFVRIPSVAE